MPNQNAWLELEWEQWKDTAGTLHMLTQIAGKTRLALTPIQNHWWNVPLYVTSRGLTTSAMPVRKDNRLLDIEFDFVAHELVLRCSSGRMARIALRPQTVAAFFTEYRNVLASLDVTVDIDPLPVEVKDPIRFDQDTTRASYDPEAVSRFWRILCQADTLFKRFSTNFYGKISPVHFFWGSFDLAVTRFNGRRAPARPGADPYTGGSLFSRVHQRWFLARERRIRPSGFLFLRRAGPTRPERDGPDRTRQVQSGSRRVSTGLRRCPKQP